MCAELTGQIEALILPIADELGVELVEVAVKRHNKMVAIGVVADKARGGITIDECAFINKQLVKAIEQQQCFADDFTVEVASPGLDRPLRTKKDFFRVQGRTVRVHLREPLDGKLEYHGEVQTVDDDEVTIKGKDRNIIIPLSYITKAVQVIE